MKLEFDKRNTQVVKGVAILCMLFYHLFENEQLVTSLQVDYRPLPLNVLLLLSGFGNICVAVFAFLSAYGITKGIMIWECKNGLAVGAGESLKDVYSQATKRCVRLVGNFLAMFLSINLLWFSKFNYKGLYGGGWQGGLYVLLDALGLAEIFETPTINMTWWYMELAIVIIFAVPLLYLAAKKLGNYLLLLAVLLPVVVELGFDMKRYYFVVIFGVLAAVGGWFERVFTMKWPVWLQAVTGTVLLVFVVVFRQNYVVYNEFGYLVDAPIALFFAWYVSRFFGKIPGIWHALYFLGKHSMNIFFVHTFFYMAIYQKFIYSFRYAALIFVVLVAVSLVYSVVLEGVKKVIRMSGRKIMGQKVAGR